MRLPVKIIILLVFTFASLQGFSQGKIETSKQEIKKSGDKKTSSASQPAQSSSSSKYDNDDKTIGQLFFEGVAKVFLYMTYYSTIGSYEAENHLHSRVTVYPYYNNRSGNYEKPDTIIRRKNHFHVDADYQYLYSHKILQATRLI